jgi:hypothetical protein
VVGHHLGVPAGHAKEADVVHFTDREESQIASDLHLYMVYMFTTEDEPLSAEAFQNGFARG